MIALDDETTWPTELRKLLDDGLSALRAFESERARIDQLAEKDRRFKYDPPSNPYQYERGGIVASIDDILNEATLLGYHCTRLCEDEIANIRGNGMQPLSTELVSERVHRRVAAGDFSSTVGQRLLAQSRADDRHLDESRSGMTWFIFTAGTLSEESGVWRLFTYWGGEALYICHEEDPKIAPVLRTLGTACIVEAAIPVKTIETFCTVGERLVRSYLHRRKIDTGHDPAMEGSVQEPIPADRILRVVTRSDADFERLTACCDWAEVLT